MQWRAVVVPGAAVRLQSRGRAGLIFFFVLSTATGTAFTAMRDPSGAFQDPAAVPVGRIGDRFSYATTWMESVSAQGGASDRSGTFVSDFEFVDTTSIRDKYGDSQPVLEVRFASGLHDFASGPVQGTQFVNLAGRAVILDRAHEARIRDQLYAPSNLTKEVYGPLAGLFPVAAWGRDPGYNEWWAYQGMQLEIGRDAPVAAPGLRSGPGPEEMVDAVSFDRPWELVGYEFPQHAIVERATLDGHTSFAVRRVAIVRFDVVDWNNASRLTETIIVSTTIWVSEDLPYPLLIEGNITGPRVSSWGRPSVGAYSFRINLVRYAPGSEPIPWTDPAPSQSHPDPPLERSGSSNFPADGTASRLGYPLSAALGRVEGDASLATYVRWKSENPGHRLVGARFILGEAPRLDGASPPTQDIWRLAFASPSRPTSTGVWIETSREAVSGVITNRVIGEGPLLVPSSWPDQLPSAPVTIGAIDSVWRSLEPDPITRIGPGTFYWGFLGFICQRPETLLCPQTYAIEGHSSWLREAWLGRSLVRPETSTSPIPSSHVDRYFAGIRMDVTTGEVLQLSRWSFPIDPKPDRASAFAGLAAAPETAPPPRVTLPGGLLPAVATTASILSALLVAFYFPALKYALTSAWGGLGGYSKLVQSRLLENPTRDHLFELIRREPGIAPPELHRRLGGGWSTIVYHLRVLQQNQLVTSLINGRSRRFFASNLANPQRRKALAALTHPLTRRVFQQLDGQTLVRRAELRRRMGLGSPVLQYHLRRLEEVGLVRKQMRRRAVYYAACREIVD